MRLFLSLSLIYSFRLIQFVKHLLCVDAEILKNRNKTGSYLQRAHSLEGKKDK